MKLLISFPFEPLPAIRMTTGQVKLLKMPDDKIRDKLTLNVKRRIQRYLRYKEDLKWQAKAVKFKLPTDDFRIFFYLETKKKENWGKAHQNTPDWDNLAKAIQDALCTSDSHIWDCRVTKLWCEPGKSRIEIWG